MFTVMLADKKDVQPQDVTPADPEVPARATRRRYTAEYKQRILREADASKPGELGALLRREGLYSSNLITWRKQRDQGQLQGLQPRKRGRKPAPRNPLAEDVARLQRELAKVTARAERAERLLELQKKVAELFGETLPPPPPELMPPPEQTTRSKRRR
jgi:transposase-like protein